MPSLTAALQVSGYHCIHVTSSRFFGGPERQMLELACELAPDINSSFISFSEEDNCQAFLQEVSRAGFQGRMLKHDMPRLVSAARELRDRLRDLQATIVCTHGYKATLLGLWAGRRCGIPVIAISRGWTSDCRRIRIYESIDRRVLRFMDKIICVSEGQARKVRCAGIRAEKIAIIRNAIRTERFQGTHSALHRYQLEHLFEGRPVFIIGAAGRLSPEKGFDVLINAYARLLAENRVTDFGLVLFGEGSLRSELQQRIDAAGLSKLVILAGFTEELDRFMPHFDVFVQSSHTEGLPNVLLEAAAAGVPVVATNVGGTAEVVVDEQTGLLVPPNDPQALATGIRRLLTDDALRSAMKRQAPQHVARHFTFAAQAEAYHSVFRSVIDKAELAR